MDKRPIKIQYKESTGEVIHVGRSGKKTPIHGLPPQASLKAILARAKALSLEIE